jgi:large subunit ribosomal protein L32
MSLPKKRKSAMKRDLRRTAKMKLTPPGFVTCSECGEHHLPHHICGACGSYNGRVVIARAVEEEVE